MKLNLHLLKILIFCYQIEETWRTPTRIIFTPGHYHPKYVIINSPPQMKTTGLMSIGQLCNHGYTVKFLRQYLVLKNKKGTIIIIGQHNFNNGTWMVKSIDNKPYSATILEYTLEKKDLSQLYHASLGFPTSSTILDIVDAGFYMFVPGPHKKPCPQISP